MGHRISKIAGYPLIFGIGFGIKFKKERQMPDYQQFYTIIGQLDTESEQGFRHLPLFLKDRELNFEKIMSTESDMHATLLDEEGNSFLHVPLSYGYYCTDPGSLSQLAVRGYIPFDKRTKTIKYEFRKKIVDELRVSKNHLEIAITTKIPERIEEEKLLLEWKTSYEGEAPLQYKVFYTNNGGETWQPVGNRTEQQQMEIGVNELPGGKDCRFAVQVTDGYNNDRIESSSTSISNKPHEVMILSPLDGANLLSQRSVLFSGQAYNPNTVEEITNGLMWFSSIDGELGSGPLLQKRLSSGEHTIKLRVDKSEKNIKVLIE
jgi:hypothetical protein